jgi:hypothetical protein
MDLLPPDLGVDKKELRSCGVEACVIFEKALSILVVDDSQCHAIAHSLFFTLYLHKMQTEIAFIDVQY